MSPNVFRRLIAILAAYALALQPITALALMQGSPHGLVLCSGADRDGGPPASQKRDVACCLGSCCGLSVASAPQALSIVLARNCNRLVAVSAPTLAPVPERYPRSRAPPIAVKLV
jgi:hypothetical protein